MILRGGLNTAKKICILLMNNLFLNLYSTPKGIVSLNLCLHVASSSEVEKSVLFVFHYRHLVGEPQKEQVRVILAET